MVRTDTVAHIAVTITSNVLPRGLHTTTAIRAQGGALERKDSDSDAILLRLYGHYITFTHHFSFLLDAVDVD